MNKLVYDKPAKKWNEALPIGNGKTGVMIFGGKTKEVLSFNNSSLWSGYPKNQDKPESFDYLATTRDLIFRGNYAEAEKVTMKNFSADYSEGYWPLGNLVMHFSKVNTKEYVRLLNIEEAVHAVSAKNIRRECFASYPDDVVCYCINSVKSFDMSLGASGNKVHNVFTDGETINIVGNAPDCVLPSYVPTKKGVLYNEMKGMSYALRAKIVTDGLVEIKARKIKITAANRVHIFISTATGFKGYNEMPETDTEYALAKCREILENVGIDYSAIKERHVADYQSIYNKNVFSLYKKSGALTSEQVKIAHKYTVESDLVELMYNYGKYLTIAGSRKNGQPLTLQGIWNKELRPAWSSNYTTNINTQMNYWGVANSNLSECAAPYIDMIYEIMQHGKSTAETVFGCRGFCCNHNVDLWRKTATVKGSPSYSYSPLCGAWLANEAYAIYKTANLEEYGAKVKEIIENAALFANDYLVLHNDEYVTCPSTSPEAYFKPKNGGISSVGMASAFDMGVIKQLFNNYLEFAVNVDLTAEINDKLSMLHPLTAGVHGIEEWAGDMQNTDLGHRHFSNLYAFYPANVIKYYGDDDAVKMIIDAYKHRMDYNKGGIGWSDAWALCIAGRMHSSEKAYDIIKRFFKKDVFTNLFNVHKPGIFQIDGNFGYVAGINAMLVYSQDDYVELLPAVPKQWADGEVKGYVVDGIELSFKWTKGYIYELSANKHVNVKNYRLASNCAINRNITIIE